MAGAPIITMDNTYGASFLGLIASALLLGGTFVQTFIYFRKYPDDSRLTKTLVIFLCSLDFIQLVLTVISIYWHLITNFGNPVELGRQDWAMNLQIDCNGLGGMTVQLFFARRVWRLSKNRFLAGLLVILSLMHFTFGVVFSVQAFQIVEIARFGELIWVTSVGLGAAASADIIIAVSLCYYLLNGRTGFARTDSLIYSLAIYSLSTGFLTGICAIVCVITFALMPANSVFLAFTFILGKLYVNSFLAALNSRDHLREKVAGQDSRGLQLHIRGSGKESQIHSVNVPMSPGLSTGRTMMDKEAMMDNQGLSVSVEMQTKTEYM